MNACCRFGSAEPSCYFFCSGWKWDAHKETSRLFRGKNHGVELRGGSPTPFPHLVPFEVVFALFLFMLSVFHTRESRTLFVAQSHFLLEWKTGQERTFLTSHGQGSLPSHFSRFVTEARGATWRRSYKAVPLKLSVGTNKAGRERNVTKKESTTSRFYRLCGAGLMRSSL